VHQGIDAEFPQRADVEIEDVIGIRLHHHLVLVVMLQAVGILAVATVGGPARRLHVGGGPWFGTQRPQEGSRVEGAGADFGVERLQQYATLLAPVAIEGLDHLLERGR
jgi:hypothetical protein